MVSNIRKLNGYIVVYCPESKYAMKSVNWNRWVYEHLKVIEDRDSFIPDGY